MPFPWLTPFFGIGKSQQNADWKENLVILHAFLLHLQERIKKALFKRKIGNKGRHIFDYILTEIHDHSGGFDLSLYCHSSTVLEIVKNVNTRHHGLCVSKNLMSTMHQENLKLSHELSPWASERATQPSSDDNGYSRVR
jgi:hypothetical protein